MLCRFELPRSRSTAMVVCPRRAKATARLAVTNDLPTPPLPPAIGMMVACSAMLALARDLIVEIYPAPDPSAPSDNLSCSPAANQSPHYDSWHSSRAKRIRRCEYVRGNSQSDGLRSLAVIPGRAYKRVY